jgi:hypothetical protein
VPASSWVAAHRSTCTRRPPARQSPARRASRARPPRPRRRRGGCAPTAARSAMPTPGPAPAPPARRPLAAPPAPGRPVRPPPPPGPRRARPGRRARPAVARMVAPDTDIWPGDTAGYHPARHGQLQVALAHAPSLAEMRRAVNLLTADKWPQRWRCSLQGRRTERSGMRRVHRSGILVARGQEGHPPRAGVPLARE